MGGDGSAVMVVLHQWWGSGCSVSLHLIMKRIEGDGQVAVVVLLLLAGMYCCRSSRTGLGTCVRMHGSKLCALLGTGDAHVA